MRSSIRLSTLLLALLAIFFPGRLAAQAIPLDALLRGARIHYSQGRYDRALETFQQALAEYGSAADPAARADIHIWLGLSEAQLRRFASAAAHFATAIELDASTVERLSKDDQWAHWSWTSLFNTARELFAQGKPDSSLIYALAAAQIDASRPGAFSLVANSYSALNRYDDMLATAREMLGNDPNSPEAHSLIGLFFLQPPDDFWSTELKAARWDSCAHYYGRAIALYEERYAEARKNLGDKLGVSAGPELDEIAANLIEKSRSRDQQVLKDYIEKDLKAARILPEIAQYASALYYAAGNLNTASSRAGSALLRASAETAGATADGFRSQAEGFFTKALLYDPLDFASLYNLGIAQYQAQNDSLAELSFRRVVEMTVMPLSELPDPLRADLRSRVTPEAAASGYFQLTGAELAAVDEAIHEMGNPVAGFAFLYLPELRARREFITPGPEDEAGMYLSIQPPAALENLYLLAGVTQTSIGLALEKASKGSGRAKLERAIVNLKAVLGLDPDNAEAWQNLIHCYRETGQDQKALEAAQRHQQLTGGRR